MAVPVGTSDCEYVAVVVRALEPSAALPVADLEAGLGTELLCAEAKGERPRSATSKDKKKVIMVQLRSTRTQFGDRKHHSAGYMMYYILSLISKL
jgi:hypothetical protein